MKLIEGLLKALTTFGAVFAFVILFIVIGIFQILLAILN